MGLFLGCAGCLQHAEAEAAGVPAGCAERLAFANFQNSARRERSRIGAKSRHPRILERDVRRARFGGGRCVRIDLFTWWARDGAALASRSEYSRLLHAALFRD